MHPPVDVPRFSSALGTPIGDYFVVLARLVPYKHVEIAVAAFAELRWPLVVIGTGRAERFLRVGAPSWITFAGYVSDSDLPRTVASARGMVQPGEEDFGIAAAESMAAGTPVIALARGGALDSVEDGFSGVLFPEPTVASLVRAVRAADRQGWDRAAISRRASRFDEDRFRSEILAVVHEVTG